MNEARNSNHFCAETVPAHIAIGLEQWRSTTSERLSNDNANQRVAMCRDAQSRQFSSGPIERTALSSGLEV